MLQLNLTVKFAIRGEDAAHHLPLSSALIQVLPRPPQAFAFTHDFPQSGRVETLYVDQRSPIEIKPLCIQPLHRCRHGCQRGLVVPTMQWRPIAKLRHPS